jgi:23S rRNA pseudouridine2605 synthase
MDGKKMNRKNAPSPKSEVAPEPNEAIRLNRYIAQSGICSRRKADEFIASGQVVVNGEAVTSLGSKVVDGDVVEVNGRRITPKSALYLLLNKPENTITTTSDDRGRKTVLDLVDLPETDERRLYPVGRLDRDTKGVLLLTNDGELAHRLMHPRYEVEKLYVVTTKKSFKPHELQLLREGVDLEDGPARADQAAYVDPANHYVIGLGIHEGRNRQVRRMFEALGHEVMELERVRYAGLTTAGIRRGKWRRLKDHEIRKLRRMVKLT